MGCSALIDTLSTFNGSQQVFVVAAGFSETLRMLVVFGLASRWRWYRWTAVVGRFGSIVSSSDADEDSEHRFLFPSIVGILPNWKLGPSLGLCTALLVRESSM